MLFIAFDDFVSKTIPLLNNTVGAIEENRRYKLKEIEYQFDKLNEKLPASTKLNGEVCFCTDILDQTILESYFFKPERFQELKGVVYEIVDRLYLMISSHHSKSTALHDMKHLPRGAYPHRSTEAFRAYLAEKNAGKSTKDKTDKKSKKKKDQGAEKVPQSTVMDENF